MPITNNTIELRKKIARDYCRSILWLDDEIRPDAEDSAASEKYRIFFHPITEEFHLQGVLCHPKGFPQIAGDDDPYVPDSKEIDICKNLAAMADVVVLDWHLGANDSKHSQKILNHLLDIGGARFVVILSKEDKLQEEFVKSYGHIFSKKDDTGWHRNEKGQFVYLLGKSVFETPGVGKKLLDQIYDEMAIAYPDYLHWAALEISARIKTYSPNWLASLPNNTDLAVLAENIHSGEDIGHALFENLIEDLKECISLCEVETLKKDALTASEWPKAETYRTLVKADLASQIDEKLANAIRGLLPLAQEEMVMLESDKMYRRILRGGHALKSVQDFSSSVKKLGEFSENISIGETQQLTIKTGSVFRKNDHMDSENIWICISQSCDCSRAENLLFLKGAETEDENCKEGATFVRFQEKQYIFEAKAECLINMPLTDNPRTLTGYSHVGFLRETVITRLISRFWSHTTRVGINQPRFIRELRRDG